MLFLLFIDYGSPKEMNGKLLSELVMAYTNGSSPPLASQTHSALFRSILTEFFRTFLMISARHISMIFSSIALAPSKITVRR
jgi:hypothetical protein